MRMLLPGLLLALVTSTSAQLSNLPGLSQITATSTGTATKTGSSATASSTASGSATQTATSASGSASASQTNTASSGSAASSFPSNVVSSSTSVSKLTGAPTLQGVGVPTLIVPYTASAPFMQKSSLPEGTVFIAVGAVLAFLGFCVVAWRGLVAWSINRSVKKAAMASIMASDTKNPGGWTGNPFKPAGGFYKQAPGGSSLSFGDTIPSSKRANAGLRNPIPSTGSGLFFSPTASAAAPQQNIPMTGLSNTGNRSSSFLPAGYYASPTSQLGGGASQTTLGGAPPYAQPTLGGGSLGMQPDRNSNNRPGSTANLAPSTSRDGHRTLSRPDSTIHLQQSTSSLRANTGYEDLPGSRAPSAYLDDLFDNHHGDSSLPPMPTSRGGR